MSSKDLDMIRALRAAIPGRAAILVMGLALASPSFPAEQQSYRKSEETATGLLAEVKAAMGGDRWNAIAEIRAEGTKTSFGLDGTFVGAEQLSTGFFEARADYGLFANAEGVDASGRWRQDNSGLLHPLDSEEARQVALTESYLARRGYLFSDRLKARIELAPGTDGAAAGRRLRIAPEGGREFILSIDPASHLPTRADIELSVGNKVITYSDFRAEDGVLLPFAIAIEHRDESETGRARITKYRVAASVSQELRRPVPSVDDVRWPVGSREALAPGYLDIHNGFFIVDANIDGKGPYPFILDTGGHDILTPAAVRQLGLTTSGRGISTGAGEGSTPTSFTKVRTLSLGNVSIVEQPFLVLHLDLGTTTDHSGRRRTIAGILGLELFERFAITMDYRGGGVTLRPAGGNHGGSRVAMRFTSDMPLVEASLDTRNGWFAVDSGNNTKLIVFRTWARSNGLSASRTGAKSAGGSSVGGEVQFEEGTAKSFVLAGRDLGAIPLLFAQDASGSLSARYEAGNLGNSILARFKPTFDFAAGVMYLETAVPSFPAEQAPQRKSEATATGLPDG